MSEGPEGGPVFRDKRRIDPETYAVREPLAQPPVVDDGTEEAAGDSVGADLVELTEDLQRLSAEYANYRRRVERDRAAVRDVSRRDRGRRAAPGARRHRPRPGAR